MQRIASGCSQNVTKINFQFPSSKAKTRERVNILFERVRVRERETSTSWWQYDCFFASRFYCTRYETITTRMSFFSVLMKKKLHLFCLYLFYPIGK